MEGASAAAHALSLPADAYGNDVSRPNSTIHGLTLQVSPMQHSYRLFLLFQPRLEVMWAIKASNHAEVYFNVRVGHDYWRFTSQPGAFSVEYDLEKLRLQLISSVDPKFLKLTKMDDQIYEAFREQFKDYDIKLLKEEDLKSDKAKEVSVTVTVPP